MRKLTIVFFDAGGGHRNAAEALKTTLAGLEWEVSLLNIQDLLDTVDIVRGVTGVRIQDAYNLMLRKGWTRMSPQLLLSLQGLIRVYHSRVVKLLRNYWAQNPTDMVLSVIPHFNKAMAESIRLGLAGTPFVTMLTDFADYPPHFWIETESEYIICGTERAKRQALALGHSSDKIFETSGMVLKPKFYAPSTVDREVERERLGLRRDLPTGLVLFGGHGSQAMVEIARGLDDSKHELQLIMLCGHNEKLRVRLQELKTRSRIVVECFTSQVDHFMSLADFFIGKPGPGSISEALQFNLPAIVERNGRTMPQERYNTEWLLEKRLGIVLPSFAEIASGVDHLLEPASFAEYSGNARSYSNRALFEVPVILDTIYRRHPSKPIRNFHFDEPARVAAWASLT
ncbi:MAG TPA: glycosyltransferase [Terriglobales bacterium]|jgi:1,2-diacylglycerol 3-beta-galactosyltransferase|nr:glycosyltransferase [Terriglobales bacterium]